MNPHKICFITCVNDEKMYQESLLYINQLIIPDGFEIETIQIKDAEYITEAYNSAMQASDAKFKVYLHQNVFINNKNFIIDIVDLFRKNPNVGMFGVVGSAQIPANGRWKESKKNYGKVYDSHSGKMQLVSFREVSAEYQIVQVIDGLIMITQYDIPWREDIFTGWDFYDLSQSIEFIRAGYQVAIPRQVEPWCIHDNRAVTTSDEFEVNKKIFLEEYSKDIFPLVSILIPTYNRPDYFKLALESAINQTYKNIEIIVGDDSTDKCTKKLMEKEYLGRFNNIVYYHNEKNMGQFDNDLKLFDMANGEYINYLMDDDLFHVTKIEKMMNYFIFDDRKELSLVTSHRMIIDDDGREKGVFADTDKIFKADNWIIGEEVVETMLTRNFNFIGEPTTVLFRKAALNEPFGTFDGRKYGCNVDQASWFNVLESGNTVYIAEVLSYFRVHSGQQLQSSKMKLLGACDYAHSVLTTRNKGFLQDNNDFKLALQNCKNYCNSIWGELQGSESIKEYRNQWNEFEDWCRNLTAQYELSIQALSASLPLVSILIPTYNQTNYLKDALDSAINQTYPNIEIIIGDDSTNSEVEVFIKKYLKKYKNITYFKNKRSEMDYGISNGHELLRRSRGDYINFLFHDDILKATKIEKMMNCFLNKDGISLVTSHRQLIDDNSRILPDDAATKRLFDKDTLISGKKLSRICIENLTNFIGEPTSVLFKKRLLREEFGKFNGRIYTNITDLATWLSLLQQGNAIYISESLSCFRKHASQNSRQDEIYITGIVEWLKIVSELNRSDFFINKDIFKKIVLKWFYCFNRIICELSQKPINNNLKQQAVESFKTAIDIVADLADDKYECVICRNKVNKFLPYKEQIPQSMEKYNVVGSNIVNFSCPYCFCHDRERHLKIYFDKLNLWKYVSNKKLLHIAPEVQFRHVIKKSAPQEYVCGDLYPVSHEIKKIDITNIGFPEEYFDLIICNHVLEHIEDDKKALSELFRVLKSGGYAILQTPYSPVLKKSFEDFTIKSRRDRLEKYGQEDHVRIYGMDFFRRLTEVGFQLKVVKNDDYLTKDEVEKYGVNDKESLILVHKE